MVWAQQNKVGGVRKVRSGKGQYAVFGREVPPSIHPSGVRLK